MYRLWPIVMGNGLHGYVDKTAATEQRRYWPTSETVERLPFRESTPGIIGMDNTVATEKTPRPIYLVSAKTPVVHCCSWRYLERNQPRLNEQ